MITGVVWPNLTYDQELIWQAAVNEANRTILELIETTGTPREYLLGGISRFFNRAALLPTEIAMRRAAPVLHMAPSSSSLESDGGGHTSDSASSSLSTSTSASSTSSASPHHRVKPTPAPATAPKVKKPSTLPKKAKSVPLSDVSAAALSSPSKTEISAILKLMSVLVALGGAPKKLDQDGITLLLKRVAGGKLDPSALKTVSRSWAKHWNVNSPLAVAAQAVIDCWTASEDVEMFDRRMEQMNLRELTRVSYDRFLKTMQSFGLSPDMTIEDVGAKLGSRDMFMRAVVAIVRRTTHYVRQWTRHRINHKIQQNDTIKDYEVEAGQELRDAYQQKSQTLPPWYTTSFDGPVVDGYLESVLGVQPSRAWMFGWASKKKDILSPEKEKKEPAASAAEADHGETAAQGSSERSLAPHAVEDQLPAKRCHSPKQSRVWEEQEDEGEEEDEEEDCQVHIKKRPRLPIQSHVPEVETAAQALQAMAQSTNGWS